MIDYLNAIRTESARFAELVRAIPADGAVPSCPEWSVADLTWHLAEVQYFWASIVIDLLDSPEAIAELPRPADHALADLFDLQTARLLAALESQQPDDSCWSWHGAGHTVGWVRRRQAHEALIHRVDAELAAGNQPQLDPELAADGVDEILTVMLDAADLPEWAEFLPDGTSARIEIEDGAAWTMRLGRFTGTSPATGTTYDDAALRLGEVANPAVAIGGSASDIDLWLWGRGPADALRVTGDNDLVQVVRTAAVDGTQ